MKPRASDLRMMVSQRRGHLRLSESVRGGYELELEVVLTRSRKPPGIPEPKQRV